MKYSEMKNAILTIIALATGGVAIAQKGQPATDWHQQKVTKKNHGIDLQRSYAELLKDKKAAPIVVAVVDAGVDINHPDLRANLWHNPGEIPFNQIDDDNNGHVDDTVGWNFIGGADGRMVEYDNLEMTRLLRKLSAEFEDIDAEDISGSPAKMARYEFYQSLKSEVTQNQLIHASIFEQVEKDRNRLIKMKEATGKVSPTAEDIEKYATSNEEEAWLKDAVLKALKKGYSFEDISKEIEGDYVQRKPLALYHYNVKYDPRGIVGDDYSNSYQWDYGNNNVAGPDPSHGTHVSGIIAAIRNNGMGMDGIADNAKIMAVRAVPDGDERDKDVANSIRYAVDNGAKIVNMSFGKGYKWDKACVDSAVSYALSKNVLLVHGSGNDHENNDYVANYPNDSLGNGRFAANWMEVGASAPERKSLAASFSNYGKRNVDIFAPGYQIYSTTPNGNYEYYDGTSMAAPVISGVAALVWSYYPSLTAVQVKEILMKSAVVSKKKVKVAGIGKARFSDLSVSGGVVNVYNALKLAEQVTTGK
jgi:subtilisin family serine protease